MGMCGGGGDTEIEETEDQRALAEIMNEKFAFYRQNYGPVEQQYFDSIERLDDQGISDSMAGVANTAAASEIYDALGSGRKSMAASGYDPSSGRSKSMVNEGLNEGAKIASGNVSRARQGTRDNYLTGLGNVVAMGAGKEADALQSMNEVAANSGMRAQDEATSKYNDQAANKYVAGQAVGAGANTYLRNGADKETAI